MHLDLLIIHQIPRINFTGYTDSVNQRDTLSTSFRLPLHCAYIDTEVSKYI